MNPLTIGMLGISALSSIFSGGSQAKAASQAARTQQDSTAQQIAYQQQAASNANTLLQPYVNQGSQAAGQINAALGTGSQDWNKYLQENPDVAKAAMEAAADGWDPLTYAQAHYQRWGQQEGRTVPQASSNYQNTPGAQAATQYGQKAQQFASGYAGDLGANASDYANRLNATDYKNYGDSPFAAQAQKFESDIWAPTGKTDFAGSQWGSNAANYGALRGAQALDFANEAYRPLGGKVSFGDSQWAKNAETATNQANRNFLSLAGGSGTALSGRTARGLQENQANITNANYNDYVSANMNAGGAVNASNVGAISDTANFGQNAFNQYVGNYQGNVNAVGASDRAQFGDWLSNQNANSDRSYGARTNALMTGYGANSSALGAGYGAGTDALANYFNLLNGQASQGFQAATGQASAGQNFANNAANATQTGSTNATNALIAGSNAQQQGYQGAANILAYGAGQNQQRNNGTFYGGGNPAYTYNGGAAQNFAKNYTQGVLTK
jgi:hypothetical protein